MYVLLSIIAICLIVIVYYFSKWSKTNEPDVALVDEPPQPKILENTKKTTFNPCMIPNDVIFDKRNLPVRTSRSKKKKVNYGKDFNAYLVKGGTIYHKKSCNKLRGKKVITKHIYECIADKNKKACPFCKPRTEIHEWYKEKFPDSIYAKAPIDTVAKQVSLFDLDVTERETQELPVIDINTLAFETEDKVQQAQQDYAKTMIEYVKKHIK